MASGIYKIRNKITDWKYIGSAVNIEVRWRVHREALRNNRHHNKHLQRAWNKYGEEAFVFSVLEECEKENLLDREQSYFPAERTYAALKLNLFYNQYPTAGSPLGVTASEETRIKLRNRVASAETRKKISEAGKGNTHLKGHKHSDETKKKMGEAHKGSKRSDETRRKMSEAQTGKVHSEERRKKNSESQKGAVHSEEHRKKNSEAQKGRVHSDETKRKIGAIHKGKITSDETKRKISEAKKKRAAETKAWTENWIQVNLRPLGWRIFDTSHD